VFRPFRDLLASLADLTIAIVDVCAQLRTIGELQESAGPATSRLDRLERDHHSFQAECEGLLMKAEGKLRAANNAEARERANKRSYEHLLDPLDEIGVESETATRHPDSGNNAPPSEAERLSALRLDVAPSPKELVKRAKFGVS